jgi:uncharacterized protein YqkB
MDKEKLKLAIAQAFEAEIATSYNKQKNEVCLRLNNSVLSRMLNIMEE